MLGFEVQGAKIEKGTFVVDMGYDMLGNTIITLSKNIQVEPGVAPAVGNFTFIKTTGWYEIETEVWQYPVELAWFNCYSFGNGVESDRIRDDFNAPQINNGFKASSTFLDYKEETIGSGLIHSSELYNATSSINGLNEFSMAQKITKSLNPIYGSIQALKTRDTDLVTFCEDKILKILANKDALFNADGKPQLTATDKVLGQSIPFVGDYGISKNPESLATDQYRMYFTDKQRGAVLRLSQDGLTPISSVGMKTWFRENLIDCKTAVGTFDWGNGEYNITLDFKEASQKSPTTISFNEGSKGWVSFKGFIINCGVSVSGKYFTAPNDYHKEMYEHRGTNWIWEHEKLDARNTFYGQSTGGSKIEILFNDLPDVVKSFRAVNYEGSQSRVLTSTNLLTPTTMDVLGNTVSTADNEYYNLESIAGWYLSEISTDMQSGSIKEFIKKENKWFNRIISDDDTVDNQIEEIFVQGIGFPSLIGATPTQTEGDVDLDPVPVEDLSLTASQVEWTKWRYDTLYITPSLGFQTYAITIDSIFDIEDQSTLTDTYTFTWYYSNPDALENLNPTEDGLVPIAGTESAPFWIDPYAPNEAMGGINAYSDGINLLQITPTGITFVVVIEEIDNPSNSTQFAIPSFGEDVIYPQYDLT